MMDVINDTKKTSAEIRGQKIYYANQQELFILAAIGKWERETFSAIDKCVVPGKIFLDIGSWVGIFSLYAAKFGARCYAIEPDEVAFRELIDNVHLSEAKREIILCRLAIGDRNGSAQLNSNAYFGNSESSLVKRKEYAGEKTVECRKLQTFIEETEINSKDISLIKIDIEGGEILLIQAAKDFLSANRPPLYISFHPAWMEPLEQNIEMITKVLFPCYEVTSATTNEKISANDFANNLLLGGEHSFLFLPKP